MHAGEKAEFSGDFYSRADQPNREGELLRALSRNAAAALEAKSNRVTIHAMDCWQATIAGVRQRVRDLRQFDITRIAEVLCAVSLLGKNTIGIAESGEWTTAALNEHGELGFRESSNPGLPFGALDLNRFHKRDRTVHARFRRRIKPFLVMLHNLRGFLASCENDSEGYIGCIPACDQLAQLIEERAINAPSLHGTLLQSPSKQQPRNLAATIIVRILRQRGYKREAAFRACADLLSIVWPEITHQMKDSRKADLLVDALRKACSRSGRPH
jgi:hypothetical protein